MASLPFLHTAPTPPGILRILPEALTHAIFVFDAYIGSRGRLDGPSYHNLLAKCIDNNFIESKDLDKRLQELFSAGLEHVKRFDKACRKARQLMHSGMWIAGWQAGTAPPGPGCPQVLFGYGNSQWDWPWVAVFNSRKSKLVKTHERWLAALRSWLPELVSNRVGIATSFGTYSYDLPAAYARSAGVPLLIVSPSPLTDIQEGKPFCLSSSDPLPYLVLSCQTNAIKCPKPTRLVCRDRLLAFLADIHWVLEIRSKGNLQTILHAQHEKQPRHLMILRPDNVTRKNAGNLKLLETFPSAKALSVPAEDVFSGARSNGEPGILHKGTKNELAWKTTPVSPALRVFPDENRQSLHDEAVFAASEPHGSDWQHYLYHYTRSCPGPWPDQSYQSYLLSLLRKEPFCGHTALDTLIRILLEGKIRASKKLVRGEQAVISWSAVPPTELQKLRQWNPALIRWTIEPYGIAVRRRLAKEKGIWPVIYGREGVYARLKQADRFRYQRHEPPDCSWKREREWRLAHDFDLAWIAPGDGFIFVPDPADLEFLHNHVQCRLPVLVLAACSCTQNG